MPAMAGHEQATIPPPPPEAVDAYFTLWLKRVAWVWTGLVVTGFLVFGVAALWGMDTILHQRLLSVSPPCPFKLATHLPCPSCGLTRGTLQLFQGHWTEAWLYQPWSFAIVGGGPVLLMGLYLFPHQVLKVFSLWVSWWGLGVAMVLVGILWWYRLQLPAMYW